MSVAIEGEHLPTEVGYDAELQSDQNFWACFFQLVEHGTNTLHVAFIFLFSIHEFYDIEM